MKRNIDLLNKKFQKKEITGIEIGVFKGEHAKLMLDNVAIKKLYLVDPYKYKSIFGKEIDFTFAYSEAKNKLKKYEKRIEFILAPAEKAIEKINKKVDFVYIDGNHRFHHVVKDILTYNRALKENGLMSGHDFKNRHNPDTTAAIICSALLLRKKVKNKQMEWWLE